jgi:hypothetical protein
MFLLTIYFASTWIVLCITQVNVSKLLLLNFPGKGSSKWVKVNEKRMLCDVLKEPDFIISGIPGLRIGS